MDIFDALTLIGGLCLFLFGMDLMGQGLERRAGSSLRTILGKLTTNKFVGFLTGLGVTAVIQSSSATTVMVVGFVNSGLMTLRQATNVILGANLGTAVTGWILSTGGIDGVGWMQFLKPTSFTPILALIGIVMYMFLKNGKSKDTGTILLGFATLMFGMDTMSDAVAGLADNPAFQQLFVAFENPLLGMLVGAVLTGIIQSSSASVGILQALSMTGAISYGAAIPIIMGQNIGTCVTAMIASAGANKNAKCAAIVHLSFNVIGTVIYLSLFSLFDAIFQPAFLSEQYVDPLTIAIINTVFKLACLAIMLPLSGLLEKLALKMVRDPKEKQKVAVLDDRLLETPFMALERCTVVAGELGATAVNALRSSMLTLREYTPALAERIRKEESASDEYEDILGTYLVKLSSRQLSDADSAETLKLLKIIGDFERISDHSVNIVESVEEMREKGLQLSETATAELVVITSAVDEILQLTLEAFVEKDLEKAARVEPLEQVIDDLKEKLRVRHILRLQQGNCTIEAGFIWADLLTNIERTSDHCSNIAECMIDISHNNMNLHESLHRVHRESAEFKQQFEAYSAKYVLPAM